MFASSHLSDRAGAGGTVPSVSDTFGPIDGFEQVVFHNDSATGLKAIIAVHSTALGPSLGGTRFYPYASSDAAVVDVCRLARGMTYKHAAAGLDQGGGKAVIVGDPAIVRTDNLIEAYAHFVDRLGGRYVTAEDVGSTQADMDLIRQTTPHVAGVSEELGGSGDPSPATAWGVWHAIRSAATHRWGSADIEGRHVVVSGVGKVGSALVGHLVDGGARVTVADISDAAVSAVLDRYDGAVAVVAPLDAHRTECDVLAPCALGAVLSEVTVPELRCEIVAGSANNQLATPAAGESLAQRGILYIPDYVANAGGVINIAEELPGYDRQRAWTRIAGIHDTVARILERADSDAVTPAVAADAYAEARLSSA